MKSHASSRCKSSTHLQQSAARHGPHGKPSPPPPPPPPSPPPLRVHPATCQPVHPHEHSRLMTAWLCEMARPLMGLHPAPNHILDIARPYTQLHARAPPVVFSSSDPATASTPPVGLATVPGAALQPPWLDCARLQATNHRPHTATALRTAPTQRLVYKQAQPCSQAGADPRVATSRALRTKAQATRATRPAGRAPCAPAARGRPCRTSRRTAPAVRPRESRCTAYTAWRPCVLLPRIADQLLDL